MDNMTSAEIGMLIEGLELLRQSELRKSEFWDMGTVEKSNACAKINHIVLVRSQLEKRKAELDGNG